MKNCINIFFGALSLTIDGTIHAMFTTLHFADALFHSNSNYVWNASDYNA